MNQLEITLLTLEEELLEAAHRVSKALRFGLTEIQPGQKLTNAERIRHELNDVHAMIELLQEANALPPIYDIKLVVAKKQRFAETLSIGQQNANAMETSHPQAKTQPRPSTPQESLLPDVIAPTDSPNPEYVARKQLSDACIRLWNLYVNIHQKPTALRTKARIKLIAKWVRAYSEEQIAQAIQGCAMSPHHMGIRDDGSAGQVYNSLELILRDPKHIEMFIEIYNRPVPQPKAKESYAEQRQHAAEDQYSYLFDATSNADDASR